MTFIKSASGAGPRPANLGTRRPSGASLLGSMILLAALASAQSIPRMPNGKPNLNGVWQHPYVPDMSKDGKDQKGAGPLPFTPWGENNFKTYDPANFDYTGH